eukprot:scaffold657_cov47-Attheya_sp.AAC.1
MANNVNHHQHIVLDEEEDDLYDMGDDEDDEDVLDEEVSDDDEDPVRNHNRNVAMGDVHPQDPHVNVVMEDAPAAHRVHARPQEQAQAQAQAQLPVEQQAQQQAQQQAHRTSHHRGPGGAAGERLDIDDEPGLVGYHRCVPIM